jgi:hypothetical protein
LPLVTAAAGAQVAPARDAQATSPATWFLLERWNHLALGLILTGAVLVGIRLSLGGRRWRWRSLPGVEAMSSIIDQAAETGRAIYFIPGSEDLLDVQTLAGLNILEQVARRTASRGVTLKTPQFHSLVMAAADDTLYQASAAVGWPEWYDPDAAFYVSDEQFGYVAGVSGEMTREQPITCFYFGAFFAESLALAEVGQTIGSFQVAGTAERAQIPFLVTACDHVLIGEELFAATAYLSGDTRQLGALKGQDFGKLLAIGAISVGCLLATLATLTGSTWLTAMLTSLQSFFRTGIRG